MNSAYGYIAALLIGASGAWYVQGIRWDNDAQAAELAKSQAIVANVDAVNAQLIASRAQTEQIRGVFLEYKQGKENETSALERAVTDGSKRLRIAAHCSAVPGTGAVSGGTGSGQPELDPGARSDYYALRRGLDQQYGLLQFCRSELRKRSATAHSTNQ